MHLLRHAETFAWDVEVLDELAETALHSLHQHDEYKTSLGEDSRRQLLLRVLEKLDDPKEVGLLLWGSGALARREDFDWLLEELETKSPRLQIRMAETALRVADFRERHYVQSLWRASAINPHLRVALAPYLAPVDLDSQETVWARRAAQIGKDAGSTPEPDTCSAAISCRSASHGH